MADSKQILIVESEYNQKKKQLEDLSEKDFIFSKDTYEDYISKVIDGYIDIYNRTLDVIEKFKDLMALDAKNMGAIRDDFHNIDEMYTNLMNKQNN